MNGIKLFDNSFAYSSVILVDKIARTTELVFFLSKPNIFLKCFLFRPVVKIIFQNIPATLKWHWVIIASAFACHVLFLHQSVTHFHFEGHFPTACYRILIAY